MTDSRVDGQGGVSCKHGTVGYCEECALIDPGESGDRKLIAWSCAQFVRCKQWCGDEKKCVASFEDPKMMGPVFPPPPPKGPHYELLREISATCTADRHKRVTVVPWATWDKIHLVLLNAPVSATRMRSECHDAAERDEGCFRAVQAEGRYTALIRLLFERSLHFRTTGAKVQLCSNSAVLGEGAGADAAVDAVRLADSTTGTAK